MCRPKKSSGFRLIIILSYSHRYEPHVVAAIYDKYNISVFLIFFGRRGFRLPVNYLIFMRKIHSLSLTLFLTPSFFCVSNAINIDRIIVTSAVRKYSARPPIVGPRMCFARKSRSRGASWASPVLKNYNCHPCISLFSKGKPSPSALILAPMP